VDRPEFIENMYRFFEMAAGEGRLVFENYFNGPDRHQLYPILNHRQSSSLTYRELFQSDSPGAGRGALVPGESYQPTTGAGRGPDGPEPSPDGTPRRDGGVVTRSTIPLNFFDDPRFYDDPDFLFALVGQLMPQPFAWYAPDVGDEG
jgi:hypothetical protein